MLHIHRVQRVCAWDVACRKGIIAWRQKHQLAKKDPEKRKEVWETERARRMQIAAKEQRKNGQAARAYLSLF